MPDLTGKIINNRYRVERFIDTGGMAVVYQVWDTQMSVSLALKAMHADLRDDPSALGRFQREARALQKLAHPHIVPFYGIEQTDDMTFLLEQFVDGAMLKTILARQAERRLAAFEALVYLKAVCSALGYAHANGVVHCDVKPGNVMVDRSGAIYLTDFGIARHAESTTTTLAGAGSPGYMAPEQIKGLAVTSETDVYALGVMTFEMLTGQRPFTGSEPGVTASGSNTTAAERVRHAHLTLTAPNPCSLNPDIPPALAAVILCALEKDPARRYASAMDFFYALCSSVGIDPAQVPSRAEPPSDETLLAAIPKAAQPPARSGRSRLWATAGLILLAVLGVFAALQIPPLRSLLAPTPPPIQQGMAQIQPGAVDSPTPQPTYTPLPTHTSQPTFTQPPTQTPLPTFTSLPPTRTTRPTATRTPMPVKVVLTGNAWCRKGPGSEYGQAWSFTPPREFLVVGQSTGWWLIEFDDMGINYHQCWISGSIVTVEGDASGVPSSNLVIR